MFVSVDLGNSRIMMMAAERQADGRLKVLAIEKDDTPVDSILNGIIKKPSDVASTLSDMVRKMENQLEIKLGKKYEIKNFYTAINGRSLRSFRDNVQRTYSSSTEISVVELNALRSELEEKLSGEVYAVFNEEYIIDGDYVSAPVGVACREINANYLIVAGRADVKENIDKCINRVNACSEIYADALAPIAMADAVLTANDRKEGVLHINFGAATTTVTVYQGGYLRHLAVVPFGGKHITRDLCSLQLSLNDAELIKEKKGTAVVDNAKRKIKLAAKPGVEERIVNLEEVAKVIEARLSEILTLCMTEVEKSGFIGKLNAGIVVSGGTSRLNDFNDYIANKTEMSVRSASLANHLFDSEAYDQTEYALLVGLLLSATKQSIFEKEKEVVDEPFGPKNSGSKNKETTKKPGLFERIKQITLFDDPEGATIED